MLWVNDAYSFKRRPNENPRSDGVHFCVLKGPSRKIQISNLCWPMAHAPPKKSVLKFRCILRHHNFNLGLLTRIASRSGIGPLRVCPAGYQFWTNSMKSVVALKFTFWRIFFPISAFDLPVENEVMGLVAGNLIIWFHKVLAIYI